MKKKLQFLFSMVALMLVATVAKAQIYIETDLTSQFADLTKPANWTNINGGAAGEAPDWAFPAVEVNGLGKKAPCEFYYWSCSSVDGGKPYTGDVFYQTVTGLASGTYKIELYGAAAFTFDRDFGSTAFTGDLSVDTSTEYKAGDKIDPSETVSTGVSLYAQAEGVTYGGEIPIYYATSFPNGATIVTLDGVVVGESGTIKIGMNKTTTSTNWHVVQLKSVIATVNAEELLASSITQAQNALKDAAYASVTGEERTALSTAVSENSAPEATADAYKAAIKAISDATTAFLNAAAGGYKTFEDVKAAIDLTAWPYASATKKAAVEDAMAASATSADDAIAKATALTKAYRQFVESNALAEGVKGAVDMTDKITNPIAAEAVATPWTVVKGEGSGGGIDVKDGEPWTDGNESTNHKYFDGGDWGKEAWDVSLEQEITLDPGKYMLTAIARASGDVAFSLYAGETKVTIPAIGATGGVFNRGWNDQFVEFEVKQAGAVKIGVQGVTDKQYNWMSFSNFRLVQLEAAPTTYAITISGGIENGTVEATPATAAEGETVKLTITPADGYELDELTVMNGETPVTIAEGYTFEMPASAVTVSATFKEIAVEPETPSVTATLVHTAGTGWGSNTGKNTVDGAAEYYNNEAGSGWAGAAFAEFGFELPNGATITKATLTWNATNGNNKDNRNNKIYYLNEGQTVDYEAITTSEPALLYTDAKTYITNVPYTKGNPSAISDETDVTDAVKALAAQKSIIFQWIGNGGGATLAGKASENAPKLVIEYIPGAPEIANATFDANAEDVVTVTLQGYQRNVVGDQKAGMQPVTGWTPGTQTESDPGYCGGVFAYGSTNKLNNKVEAPATAPEGSESASALGLSAVWAGVAQYTQEVTLPAGDYKFTYTVYNGANTGDVTKNLFGFRASGGTEYFSEQKKFTVGEWATYEVAFTLDQETSGNISVGFIGSGGSGNAPHLFVDNVTLTKIPGVELALIDLQKSLEAAADVKAKYVVGDGLFQYAASEIEPLTNAITTAQAAYNAAESKDAVNSAKETLDAFVATFAPVMTTPAADKLYTLQNKQASEQALEGEEVANHYLTLSAEGIGIATTPQALKFEAAEGGKFYITDGEYYVGLAGTDGWSMSSAADKKEALTISATLVGEVVYYTLGESKGMVGADYPKKENKGCWANKGAGDGDAVLWTIAEYVEPTDPNDYTNMIVNADLTGEGGFDDTGTKHIDGSGVVKVGNAAAFDFKQTIANLPAGQYKLTAQAAYRYGGDEAAEAAAIAGGTETKLIQLYATVGEKTVATPIQNRYDGASETDYANGEGSVVVNEKYVPNSTNAVKAWFAAGQYVNEVIFNIAEAGDVTIGINRTGTPESDYTVIGPWTLYRLGDAVVPNPTYEIAIKGGIENGTVKADATEAEAGATVKLTITPAEGYELKSISISYGEDEDAKTIEPDEENSFIMPAAPVVIDAVFSEIIPDIVLNAPTFNAEEGTQAEPNMLPEGSTLKINYTAENLEANGLTADDVKVKVTVMVSGDLPEAGMSMGSTTAHRVMGETFYIPLGETDFPVALKPGYVYQNVAVMAAELVKPATDTEKEETLAAVGAPVQLHWVGIYDDLLIEIAQDQGKSLDDFPRTEFVEGDDYNTYTCTEGIQVAFKMFDIDVKDCDYVIVKFAEPVAAGWELAFWAHNDQSTVAVPAGATEYKYVFADDTKCAIQNGILPQICMLRLWSGTPPLEAKVTGVYKHYLGNEVAQEINVERYPGMGYTATEATVDFALAKRVLGVKEVTSDMLRIVNPDNTEISDCAQYDGWFNAEGVAEAWNASTTKVCAKFFQAIPNGTFEICDMNGADEVGKTYSVKWALVANDKKVVYTINVTFVEKPAIALTFDDLNVVDEKAADFSFKLGTSYQSEKATVDVAAILDKLEVESLSDVTIYAVQSDGSLDDNYKLGTTDGWRNAAGDWQGWGADAFFYVKANFAATENQLYEVGTMDPTQNTTIEAGTFTAKYAFVKGNDTHDAVVLSVNVALVDPVGINSIEIAKAKGNGKYLDKKGHIIIVNDNKAFSLNGIETE